MRSRKSLGMGLLFFVSTAGAQSKPEKAPQLLLNAQFVYVEPLVGDGKFADPNVSVEDRQAVTDVSRAMEKWGQYKLAARRSEAELVVAVRVGPPPKPAQLPAVKVGQNRTSCRFLQ